jgi:hypothetical protein
MKNMAGTRGLGKCAQDHPASFGYPTRPEDPYPFCPICGNPVVWKCAACGRELPDDSNELIAARFCRYCGAAYFGDQPTTNGGASQAK